MTVMLAPVATAPLDIRTSRDVAVVIAQVSKRFPVRRGWVETVRHPFSSTHVDVVDRVTFDVCRGEFFGLLGPNGAGKTTLFRMIAASLIPDEGGVSVFGSDVVRDIAQAQRTVACVMANDRTLYWRLSAVENLRLSCALYGIRGKEARRRIEEVLVSVDLADTGEKMVAMFSTGMKQRLLIARALLSRPRLLLLDEPTRSLDPVSARNFREFLRTEIVTRQRCTVLLATHSSEEAIDLCDRVAVLDRGRLLAVGSAAELSRRGSDQRFAIWTPTPDHPALAALVAAGHIRECIRDSASDDEWPRVLVTVEGGLPAASDLVARLVRGGMRIGRYERVRTTLAELIERIVDDRGRS